MRTINFFRNLWERFRAKTPLMFRNLQKFLVAISFVAGMGMTQLEQLPKWAWLEDALRFGVFAGLLGAFLAQFTREDVSASLNAQKDNASATLSDPKSDQANTTPNNDKPNNTI